MPITRITPVLRVQDVARNIQWYQDMLRFSAHPFPNKSRYEFEITDPDGYVLCLAQSLEDQSDLPSPEF